MPELRAFHIALPPPGEQQEIVAQVSRILTRADLMREAADVAASTAERLLPKAVAHAMGGGMATGPRIGPSASDELEELRRERARHTSAALVRAAPRRGRMDPIDPEDIMQQPALPDRVDDDLVGIIASGGGTMRAADLWARSGLPIDAFYRILRDAVNAGRISETEEKEVLRAH